MAYFTSFPVEPFDAAPVTNTHIYNPLKDFAYVVGLVLLSISAGVLLVQPQQRSSDSFAFFLLHYGLAFGYAIFLAVNRRLRWWLFGARPADYPTLLLSLLLWTVSCFALNRQIAIFKPSATWLDVHLAVSFAACIAYAWKDRMPTALRGMLYFVLAATALLFAYYAVCTLPLLAAGLMLFWFFGLPLHGLIPVVFTVYLGLILRSAGLTNPRYRLPVFAGLATPIVAVLWFSSAWFLLNKQVVDALDAVEMRGDSSLPRWVAVSQRLKNTPTTGKMLEAVANGSMQRSGRNPWEMLFMANNNADNNDPLMQVASAVSPVPDLSRDECTRIYASLYDGRHRQEERLWSGDNLETKTVATRVLLDPGHRLSYTEKTLTVGHRSFGQDRGSGTQEALYTFFLPEGGVVTSLSLWINGQEEPALLTSKSKAKEAYTTIVGRERRDPAVVHWQEGHTVQLRVFPVTPEMPRRFKIGITAPLRLDKAALSYQNVSFDGPSALLATEQDSLFFLRNGHFTAVPAFFQQIAATIATYDGPYRHTWSAACQAAPLSRTIFSFDGKNYAVAPYTPQAENFRPEKIYLDLNWAWTTADWQAVRPMLRQAAVYIPVADSFELLTADNASRLFRQAKQLRFSLFPFHRIEAPEQALVIAKSAHPSLRPADLGEAAFRQGLRAMSGHAPIRVFHLGNDDPSAYLEALAEARTIRCQQVDLSGLGQALSAGVFPQNVENAHTVVLPSAGLLITEQDSATTATQAPDHLFRLFAYQSILRDLGLQQGEPEDLVRLAEQAYVVTPVSSLVTLETQADYDRFQIKPTEMLNSLGNASFENAGSVPEPHEWALILLLAVAVLWSVRGSWRW